MKSNYLFLAAVASVMLASCSNDTENNYYDGTIRLTTTDMSVTTRSIDQDIQSTQFLADEKVDIFLQDGGTGTLTTYTQPLVCTADGSGNLTFDDGHQYWPINEHPLNIWGVYPSGAAGTNVAATDISFTVKADQSADDNYKASDLMTGVPTAANPVPASASYNASVPLTFKHLLSKINITLSKTEATLDITDAMLKSAKLSLLNINPTAHFVPKSYDLAAAADGTASEIVLYDGITTANSELTYSGIIPPQTIAEGTEFIKIEIGDDTFIYSAPAGGITLAAKTAYNYNIKIHKANIILTSTITDWVGTTEVPGTAILQ